MPVVEPPFVYKERLARLAICIAVGVVLWNIAPPMGVSLTGWKVFAVFMATIVSFLLQPFQMGPSVLMAMTVLAGTGTLSFPEVVSGYGHHVVWLIVAAFFIASTVEFTELGRRIALSLVHLFGKSTLGLGYAVALSELILAPFIPSNTARGGGLMAPIVSSLSRCMGSHPKIECERCGAYLVLTGVHANLITCAMFLTAMAANPLVVAAADQVFQFEFTWSMWALGALVPGLVCLLGLPVLLYVLEPPVMVDAQDAVEHARQELGEMGPWSRSQKTVLVIFVLLLVLWSTSSLHGMSAALVAWIGVSLIFLFNVQPWESMIVNPLTWDAVIWIGGLIMMATALKDYGVVSWFADSLRVFMGNWHAVPMIVGLAVLYYYLMYGFSMLTGHITALLVAFLTLAFVTGAPVVLTVALFAYFSNLCAAVTHYSTGSTVLYYGLGYVTVSRWLHMGFLVSLYHMVIWLGIGLPWWKLLGWW